MPELLPGIHAVDNVSMLLMGAAVRVCPALIVEEGRLTLIDAGPAGSEAPIRAYVEGLGYRLRDIERIVVTHHHSDHTGALARLAGDSGAVVSAHTEEVPVLERRVAEPARPLTPRGVRAIGIDVSDMNYALEREWESDFTAPAVTVVDYLVHGDVLPILGGLTVLHAPGHTPGHIALWSESRSVLFAADLFTYDGSDILAPLPIFTQDEGQSLSALRAITETYHFNVAIPYHGAPIMESASERLRNALAAVRLAVSRPEPGAVMPGK
ncbi:MAG: MBL fold metallo-hydrolase [Armatimonadetes bacterium]|nr:MBL fold metallo-hydrolase [Armatimonadota bacterium]